MWSVKATGRVALFISLITLGTVVYVNIYSSRMQSATFSQTFRRLINTNDVNGTESVKDRDFSTNNPALGDSLERNIQNDIMREAKENLKTNFSLEHIVKLDPEVSQIFKELNLGNLRLNINHTMNELSQITDLLKRMVDNSNSKYDNNMPLDIPERARPLLILFTTWTKDPNRYDICNATIQNWASLRPAIQPVLFSNDSDLVDQVKQFGWKALDISKSAENGLPVLKYMYIDARRNFDSVFYAFSNSDILFNGNLLKTLFSILYSDHFLKSKHVLISGVRTNLVDFTENEVNTKQNLRKAASERGAYFQTSAEDYFITDKNYPWEDLPEVVVGSVAYDNWLVADARNKLFTTIDITATAQAVHISHEANQYQSHSRNTADYNKVLLAKLFGDNVNYHRGFTDCMAVGTEIQNDTIVFKERTQFAFYC